MYLSLSICINLYSADIIAQYEGIFKRRAPIANGGTTVRGAPSYEGMEMTETAMTKGVTSVDLGHPTRKEGGLGGGCCLAPSRGRGGCWGQGPKTPLFSIDAQKMSKTNIEAHRTWVRQLSQTAQQTRERERGKRGEEEEEEENRVRPKPPSAPLTPSESSRMIVYDYLTASVYYRHHLHYTSTSC